MARTLLVDADIVAFKFSAATEQVFHFEGKDAPPCIEPGELSEVLQATDDYIEGLATQLKASAVIICLTDVENFRLGIYPEYKSNRKGSRKPTHLLEVKEHFRSNYRTYQRPGLEADDCMGILATHKTLIKGDRVIVSEDKDMQTIPGLLFNPAKDNTIRRISPLQADRFHLWQTIVGDTSDGYPGARGIGPKSPEALAVLESASAGEAWQHVKAAFARKGLTEQDALVQARCARILRAQDWDFESKKPRLWMPPKAPS